MCTHAHIYMYIYTFMRRGPVGIGHKIIQDGVRESGAAHLPALLLFQVYALCRLTSSTYLRGILNGETSTKVYPLPEPPPGARINESQRPRERGI